jgi:hypothetical protein
MWRTDPVADAIILEPRRGRCPHLPVERSSADFMRAPRIAPPADEDIRRYVTRTVDKIATFQHAFEPDDKAAEIYASSFSHEPIGPD